MTLELAEKIGTVQFAINPETGWVFAKTDGLDEWRYVVMREVKEDDEGVYANLVTAPIRSLTTVPA